MTLSLPPGSTFAQTFAAAEQARALVQKNPHVKLVYTAIGGGSAGGDPFAPQGAAEVRKATLTINMTPRQRARRPEQAGHRIAAARRAGSAARRARQGRLRRLVGEVHPGAGRRGRPRAGRACARRWSASCAPSPASATSPPPPAWCGPELIVRPDFARAADLGVTSAAIADTLRIATAGDYDQGLAKLNLSQRQVPVVVKLHGRRAHRPRAAVAPGGARRARPGDAGQRRHAGDRQRPGADRPLRPAAQHQLRDRAEPAAAGRGRAGRAGAAQPEEPAARRDRRPPSATPRPWPSCSPASAWPC